MTNEVLNAIAARRSCRSYEAKQIPDEALDAIVTAGTWAPNGMGKQSAKIVFSIAVVCYFGYFLYEFAVSKNFGQDYSAITLWQFIQELIG